MCWNARLVFGLVMLCMSGVGVGAGASAQEKIKITIAHPPVALHLLPTMVAEAQGFYAAEGLDVSNVYMAGGSAGGAALMGGSVEAASGALSRSMVLQSKGIKVKMICAMAGARDWAIVVDAKRRGGVSSLTGLKGLKIATPRRGSDADQIIRVILEEAGLHVGPDVQLVQIDGFQNQMIALGRGDVDGAILAEPFVTMGVRQGTIKRVLDLMEGQGPEVLRKRIWTAIMVKQEFLDQRSDVAAKIVRALTKSVQAIYADPKMAIAVAAKNLPSVERPVLEEMIPHVLKANNPKAYGTRISPEAIAAENEWLATTGDLTKKVQYEDVVATAMSK